MVYKVYADVTGIENMTPAEVDTWLSSNTSVAYDKHIYNLQNRLSGIEKYSSYSSLTSYVDYKYNDDGIRVEKDDNGTVTTFLIDSYNHTGYAQVLEEWTVDGSNGTLVTYTIGDDVISQQESDWIWDTNHWVEDIVDDTQYLLYDGHGSTRQLVYWTGSDITVADTYSYDGYGVLLQDDSVASSNPGFTPDQATSLLYAGEHFDTDLQQYYLRARFYDPLNGRFNRTDPFAGSHHDPQSLHKYLYCHANPVNGIDPTGMMELNIGAVLRNVNIMSVLKASVIGGVWGAGINVTAGLIMRGGEITVNQFLWDACTGFALGALSGGTASLFNQIGVGLAKQFLGRLGWQLGLRLTLSFGTYSMSAMYDTLYDAWVIKREDGRWPSGKKFWGLYKINLAINCTIGFAVDAVKISGDTLMRNINGDFSSASSRKRARMKYNALTKDQKQIERGISKVLEAAGGSSWTATISTLSANVTQKIAKEEWDGELNLDD